MLSCYALQSFRSAYVGQSSLNVQGEKSPKTTKKIIVITLAFTLLNPHVYIDTVVIMGGIAGQLTTKQKFDFVIGAIVASGIWFFGIGYGASRVAPYFKRALTWRVLDFIIGVIMVKVSWNLFHGF
jgi:L-lysine exporter family protein LysE/ArgO